MIASASVASVLVRCYSRRHRSTSGLLLHANCAHHVQHVQRGARDVHGLLICRTPLTALVHATPVGSGSEGLLYLPCAAVAADLEQMALPEASQRLQFQCKPLGYGQGRLEVRLSQRQERLPPLQAPIPTKMVVSASVASVACALLRRCYSLKATSEHQRPACCCAARAASSSWRVHGLLIAAV